MKTTVVKGVLTSYELMLAILFRWRVLCATTILCGSDAVTDPVTGRIILNYSYTHSICRRRGGRFVVVGVVHAWVGQILLNCYIFKSFFYWSSLANFHVRA